MIRSVFAIAPDHRACNARLQAAGFDGDEISPLAAEGGMAERQLSCNRRRLGATWLRSGNEVTVEGRLALLLRDGEELINRLAELGVPAYAALRFEDEVARESAVVTVHTENGFEIEIVRDMRRPDPGQSRIHWSTVPGGCRQTPSPSFWRLSMSLYTGRFLELVAANGLDRTLPQREPEIAAAMDATVDELKAWLGGAPMSAMELARFEAALPALSADLPAPPGVPD